MAIRNIKEVINNRGYVINPTDRKIFEELPDLQSFFGFSKTDAIEFIIYDVNDNQLPQSNGELVRYIPLSTENINDYFLIPEGTIFQKYQLPKEYFIDVERLLQEAGYTNGIFKTQITLLNKRVGSNSEFDKLWIQEISPSRTEVRLLPLKEGLKLNDELRERFDAFVNDKEFREDTILYAFEVIEKINPTEISNYLINRYSHQWYENFNDEFKVNSFDILVKTIYDKFVKSVIYEFTNRVSIITDVNYGNPKPTKPSITLSKDDVLNSCRRILAEIIDNQLPPQDVRLETDKVIDFIPSIDPVGEVLQRTESDIIIQPREVEYQFTNVTKPIITERQIVLQKLINSELGETQLTTIKIVTPVGEPGYTSPVQPRINTSLPQLQIQTNDGRIIEKLTQRDSLIGFDDIPQIFVRDEEDPFSLAQR
jgi:hypothetical protein